MIKKITTVVMFLAATTSVTAQKGLNIGTVGVGRNSMPWLEPLR